MRYLDGRGDDGSSSGGRATEKKPSAGTGKVLLALLVPILLPLLALAACYWQASKEGLAGVLKEISSRRDRQRKRRGAKAGGGFRQRSKLSQDGKGGRSANA